MRLGTFRDPGGDVFVGEVEGDRVHRLEAASMLAWLAGEGRRRSGGESDVAGVAVLAPVPEPPSVRDFYAFERHVAAGWRRRGADIPEHWYAAPAFYFSNPASVVGPGEAVGRPAATEMLDFELEIAAVIAGDGAIAGFTLMNDWSARDVQAREVTVGLGPHKAKDFATSLGPWLVTPDELPYEDGRLRVTASVTVNGIEVTRTDASEKHFGWPEIVAHAARDTRLRAGDVLGSGTLAGGCLLELGPQDLGDGRGERWIEPGDVVALHAEGLGTLETPIAASTD
ncbi:MAG: fumarylacetoacetate hydrolase family protein [Solirubrobacterales bacterium]